MAEQHYAGGCHCGAVRYEVDLDLEKGSIRCNCSLCGKSRAWFAFTTADKFDLKSGEGDLISYRWTPPNRPEPNLTYYTCSTCGVRTHAEGMDPKAQHTVAVQLATLEGADPEVLARSIHYVDGRHDRFDRQPENTAVL